MKQEADSKTEARSKLNKALEASATENEEQNIMESDEEEEEEMLDEEMVEEIDSKKNIIKTTEHYDDEEQAMDEEEEEFEPVKNVVKAVPKQPKVIPQASYIMKLFDRSVNLAKFDEETPLYPLCRAWMKNQPRAPTVKAEKSTDPIFQTVEDGDLVEMPKIKIRKHKQIISRPESKLNKKDFDKLIDSEVWTKEKLLEYHRKQWSEEKARHIEASRLFEEKHFTANLQLLESLRKDAEE